ncbi:flavin-containing monooxygenase [Mycobacterium triplex]|uniref:Monooxygenase n=3 Tax=Mycobacterium triplex TaxID=47839 RepID=A0A024JZW7_9MYCO|nr:NAD(P)/FAD-dependent oxidoreductase [Mycobacterium triplex]CDO88783.1 monooxygenase [Mycobacterium triplex]
MVDGGMGSAAPIQQARGAPLDVVVIGAGVSGLCVAHQLQRAGFSYRVLEQARDLGGTWRDNTYPGCGCDIPAPLYSFSFAQRANWSRLFASQPEILEYLHEVAAQRGVRQHIDFATRAMSARWQESRQSWTVETSSGAVLECRYLVSATGLLRRPRYPDIAGRTTFAGNAFHSARWDDSVPLRGKRIAVIGSGASAIQFVPRIAPDAKQLTLFQRTPGWVVPKADRTFSRRQQQLRRFAPYRWYTRSRLFWIHERRVDGFVESAAGMADAERLARLMLQRKVTDPQLRDALTPDYAIGCKRLLLSNDYYPALTRDNVTVVSSAIAEMTAGQVKTADGQSHDADVVIYATGFDTQFAFSDIEIVGRDGERLSDRWQQGSSAYLGTTVSGFPNYFVMLGPNSGLGHNSQIFMIEAQARYVLSCLKSARRRKLGVLTVRPSVEGAFNDWLQGRLAHSVWQAGGCHSWYQHPATGKNTALWPSSAITFWRKTHRVRLSDYHTRPRIDLRRAGAFAGGT